jgi:hypothetical protein
LAAITLLQAQAQLDAWLAASLAVAQAQSYEIAGRKLTRADAQQINQQIKYWSSQVATLQAAATGSNSSSRSSRTRTVLLGR